MAIFSLAGLISQSLQIGAIEIPLDGITDVTPTNSRLITQHPTDEGFNISDAQHQLPIKVVFKAWITDTPQSVLDSRIFASIANATGLELVEGQVKKELAKIEKMANLGLLITVKTKYALYKDFYLEDFRYTETPKKGIQINFSIMEKQENVDDDRTTANFADDLGLWS